MSGTTWRREDLPTSQQAVNFLRDEAFESRLTSLRDVAIELLNAVDSLRATSDNSDYRLKLYDEVRKFEADLIRTALIRTSGNQSRAARLLGVKHTTLNAKIKRYGISQGVDGIENGRLSPEEQAA